MTKIKRRFEAVSDEGRKFTIVEYASYRWERNHAGERCQVENETTWLETLDGVEVVPTSELWSFEIPSLGFKVRELDEADTLQNSLELDWGELDKPVSG